jgi:hypothetical protein
MLGDVIPKNKNDFNDNADEENKQYPLLKKKKKIKLIK